MKRRGVSKLQCTGAIDKRDRLAGGDARLEIHNAATADRARSGAGDRIINHERAAASGLDRAAIGEGGAGVDGQRAADCLDSAAQLIVQRQRAVAARANRASAGDRVVIIERAAAGRGDDLIAAAVQRNRAATVKRHRAVNLQGIRRRRATVDIDDAQVIDGADKFEIGPGLYLDIAVDGYRVAEPSKILVFVPPATSTAMRPLL